MTVRRIAVCLVVGSLLLGCATKFCGFKQNELEESFVPLPGYTPHQPVACERVVYFEKAPTDRKFREVGIISPRGSKQKSWGDAMHAGLAAAALKGADAVFPLSEKEMETWGFSAGSGGAFGGKKNYYNIRLKAIAWDEQSAPQ